ncbi:Uncharacterised protein [Citrobacter freundii]|nr:Uncharacterised protein [Citrobacter freundii]
MCLNRRWRLPSLVSWSKSLLSPRFSQIEKLKTLLAQPDAANRVLALDHWMARNGAMQLALGKLGTQWQGDNPQQALVSHFSHIVKIDGFFAGTELV